VNLLVAGGGLQGVEAAYLAKKAGWQVTLVDCKEKPPALGLVDRFVCLDIVEQTASLPGNIDLVIPALEDDGALAALEEWSHKRGIPFAFDSRAYTLSSSKLASDRLFAELDIPAPPYWPQASFPLLSKPDNSSGSKDVRIIHNEQELDTLLAGHGQGKEGVLQEYLQGPYYSLEVLGSPGNYKTLQVTELEMDSSYDCKRVIAPASPAPDHSSLFHELSLKIASALKLKGLMDVEAVLSPKGLFVLEIDARLPSQTPIAVFHSTGFNMVVELARLFGFSKLPDLKQSNPARTVILEHIRVGNKSLEVAGEHVMTLGGPLALYYDFFGANEALTDYEPGKEMWSATLILTGANLLEIKEKREKVIRQIMDHCKINRYRETVPVNPVKR